MPSSKAIIDASRDSDLLQRTVAMAAVNGSIPGNVQSWVESHFQSIIVSEVGETSPGEDGMSRTLYLADVHEYGKGQYEKQVREINQRITAAQAELAALQAPGSNPSYVTDVQLENAIRKVLEKATV